MRIEVEPPVGRLVLNRDAELNVVSIPMLQAMTSGLGRFAQDDAVRAVVLAGEGRSFSAGEDTSSLDFVDLSAARSFLDHSLNFFATLETFPKPVVAAVQGQAYGFGSEVLLCVDVVLASPSACFGFVEIDHGTVPAVLMTRGLGVMFRRRALYLALTGVRFDAEEAKAYRLVHEIVEDPRSQAEALALRLSSLSPAAVAMIKRRLGARAWDEHQRGKEFMPEVLVASKAVH